MTPRQPQYRHATDNISQSSVATYFSLRRDLQTHLLLSMTVKNNRKSANIWQSTEKRKKYRFSLITPYVNVKLRVHI